MTDRGVGVFPGLADVQDGSLYQLSGKRSSTGIEALDKVLGEGGYWSGAATMVAGPSGIGKTLMGLHFLFRGAEMGQPGILATFQENETQLKRVAESFGWKVEGSDVHILSRSVVDINIDEWVYQLLDLIEKTKARRIVIDSLPDVITAAADPTRSRKRMSSL